MVSSATVYRMCVLCVWCIAAVLDDVPWLGPALSIHVGLYLYCWIVGYELNVIMFFSFLPL